MASQGQEYFLRLRGDTINLHDLITKITRKVIGKDHPDLNSVHYPVKAKVMKVYPDSEYVDIQVLDVDGEPDESIPEIPMVKADNKFKIDKIIVEDEEIDMIYKDVFPETSRIIHFPNEMQVQGWILLQ